MKNLFNFEEFVNESFLNEALDSNQKSNAKKIADITKKFLEKDLSSLVSKYDCMITPGKADKYALYIDSPKQRGLLELHTWAMGRTKNLILGYCYVNGFVGPAEYVKEIPWSIKDPMDQSIEIQTILLKWRLGPYEFLDNPSIVKSYQVWVDSWLDGIEENLKFYKKEGVI